MSRYPAGGIAEILRGSNAVWQYSEGSPVHAELTSGLHSNLYLNLSKLAERPALVEHVCHFLLNAAKIPSEVRYFAGIALGSITLAHECARQWRGHMVFAEKRGSKMEIDRFTIPLKTPVVIVEDVLMTADSVRKVALAIREHGAQPYSKILTVVNRSGQKRIEVNKRQCEIVSAVEVMGNEYTPEACPLCVAGSKALRPKIHWREFVQSLP